MFVQCPDALKYAGDDVVEIWYNNSVALGDFENRQALRKYKNGSWTLDVNISFNNFKIPLQDHQARAIINSELGNYFECQVVDHKQTR
jgi:hypothetical protein